MSLVIVIVAIYAPVRAYQFVDFDDDIYVAQNPHVQAGLTADSLKWAFTTTNLFYWQPLVWVSHMLDCQFFGLNPGPHHTVNVALHAANAVLLFLLLHAMTRARWRSALVAGLFAVHPLRVESVAWISERKDVLSGLFWILTLWAYYFYTKRTSIERYLIVLAAFALGLMTKPMLVTLPFILLVMDYWPLGRWTPGKSTAWRLIREKLPLMVLSLGVLWVTMIGLHEMGVTVDLPWTARIANALFAYSKYLAMLLWPAGLSVLYPYRLQIPFWQLLISSVALILLTAIALRRRKRNPYLYSGWLWYGVALAPTVGLLQSGPQAFADRYTYLPSIGILIAVIWWVAEETQTRSALRIAAISAGLISVFIFSWISASQVPVWESSVSLFSHAAEIAPNSAIVQHNLGYGLAAEGRYEEAISHYELAIQLDPHLDKVHYNLGRALYEKGQLETAIVQFRDALSSRLPSGYESDVRNALGIALTRVGKMDEAAAQFQAALKLKPQSPEIHANWGSFLARTGNLDAAVAQFKIAVQLKPSYAEAHLNLGRALSDLGRRDEALKQFQIVKGRQATPPSPFSSPNDY